MVFHVLTLFEQFFEGPFGCGIVKRALDAGRIDIRYHNLRAFTFDRHRTVDDRPFGGEEGMVIKIEPVFRALEGIRDNWTGQRPPIRTRTVLLSAQGRLFTQADAARLAAYNEIVLICGRYEGVDERVAEHLADEELSVGDFVLSGGEWACGIVVDCVARLVPGVLGNEASARRESFQPDAAGRLGILDCPQYTRPADFHEWKVPEILLSGDHEEIRRWRRRAALEKTARNRPELLEQGSLNDEDRQLLGEIASGVAS